MSTPKTTHELARMLLSMPDEPLETQAPASLPPDLPTLDEAAAEFGRLWDDGFARDGTVKDAIAYAERFGFTIMDRHRFLIDKGTGVRLLRQRIADIRSGKVRLG